MYGRGYGDRITYLSKTREIQVAWIPVYIKAVSADLVRVDTDKNTADMMTKIPPTVRRNSLLGMISVAPVSQEILSVKWHQAIYLEKG